MCHKNDRKSEQSKTLRSRAHDNASEIWQLSMKQDEPRICSLNVPGPMNHLGI